MTVQNGHTATDYYVTQFRFSPRDIVILKKGGNGRTYKDTRFPLEQIRTWICMDCYTPQTKSSQLHHGIIMFILFTLSKNLQYEVGMKNKILYVLYIILSKTQAYQKLKNTMYF